MSVNDCARTATSIQSALEFIRQIRSDPSLRREVAALDDADIDGLVRAAAAAGFVFTADDLAQAHRHDWAMRWARIASHGGAS